MPVPYLAGTPGRLVKTSLGVGPVRLPVWVAAGACPGPTLYLQALQHPTEVMGVEVIRTVADALDLQALRGRVVMVPVANPLAAAWANGLHCFDHLISPRERRRCQRVNMNRVWPGRPDGNLIEQMAHALWEHLCRHADAIVDFHCCRLCDHYFAAAPDGHQPSIALARAFGAPLVDLQTEQSYAPGLLFLRAAALLDRPAILVEMSPHADVTYPMVANGVSGVFNLLRHLRMLPGRPPACPAQAVVRRADPVRIFRAKREGYLTTFRQVGEVVDKGDLLCEVRSLDRFRVLQRVRAPFRGTCPSIGPGSGLRLVKVGEEICTFKRLAAA